MKQKNDWINYFAIFLIFAAATMRIARHFGIIDLPPNFAPVGAVALFSAVYLNKKQVFIIPIFAMLVADIFIGFYNPAIMLFVYLSFILTSILGLYIKNNKTISNIIGGSLVASILFFLITNFAVWVFSGLYPQTLTGLYECYIMAIPFFRNTLLGDLFYVTLMFGSYEFVKYIVANKTNNNSQY
jgi:hypothetical protein